MRKKVKGTWYPRFFITMYGAIDSNFHLEHYENDKIVYFSKKMDDYNAYLNEMMKVLHQNLGQFSKEAEKLLYKMNMNYMELSCIDPSSSRGKKKIMNVKIKNHALSLELLDLKNDYLKKRNKLLDELDKEENGLQVYLIHYGKGMNLGAKKSDIEIPRFNYRTDEKFINYKKVEDDLLEKVMKGVSDNETL
ncbi:hypothetical protein [Catenibacterium mitsuokai]|uniref:hypothetical protein n=1 Tax=Catenibacterium mitsuokai TaxID=100886 RepID=UPI00242CC22B|nr:hypothetical protein [Catenibacterium mitsuokai]MCI6076707.1 hypothetical protein [Catenibacterium mitsuokai]